MCGPVVPWDWFIIDISYVLVLVGGGMIFRVRSVSVGTWMLFGFISTVIGGLLFYFTWDAQMAFKEAEGGVSFLLNQGTQCGM